MRSFARHTGPALRAAAKATQRASAGGFTLVEVLIVVALVAILATMTVSTMNPGVVERLRGAATVVAAELDEARNLAVAHNSSYRLTVSFTDNRLVLTHVGANAALNTLPASPWAGKGSTSTARVLDLDDLPLGSGRVQLYAVGVLGSPAQRATFVEFGPLGQTSAAAPTAIWLAAGNRDSRRYVELQVNPITGLVTVGAVGAAEPPAGIVPASVPLVWADAAAERVGALHRGGPHPW